MHYVVQVPQWRAGRNVLVRGDTVSRDFLEGALGRSRVESARRLGFIAEAADPPAEDLSGLTKAELLKRIPKGIDVPARTTKLELLKLLEN
jgi:hypothetical protein